jgi:hypothetical protein
MTLVQPPESPKLTKIDGIFDPSKKGANSTETTYDPRDTGRPDTLIRNVGRNGTIRSKADESSIKPGDVTPHASTQEAKQEAKQEDRDARKLYLDAQKAERKANELLKKNKERVAQADKVLDAISRSKADPYALADAAGFNRTEYLDSLVNSHFKASVDNKPENPVQQEVAQLKAQIAEYADERKRDNEQKLTTADQMAVKNHINTVVIPLLKSDLDKYEGLLTAYSRDGVTHEQQIASAAQEVINMQFSLYNDYIAKGNADCNPEEIFPLASIAENLDTYHNNILESGIINTLKSKRFAKYAAQSQTTNSANASKYDTNAPIEYPVNVTKPKLPPANFVSGERKAPDPRDREAWIAHILAQSKKLQDK